MWSRNASVAPRIIMLGLIVLLSSSPAQATVYGWRSEEGIWHLSNDLESVPEARRAAMQKFTSKLVGASASVSAAPEPSSAPTTALVNLQMNAYERGLERGLQSAERQVALAGELARNIVASVPRSAPPRIIIQQPGPTIIREVSPAYDALPFYGFLSPYASFSWGFPYSYSYGFRRLVPHSHFFPGSRRGLRARRTGLFFSPTFRARHGDLFFPDGHFSHHGFLAGHGFVFR
jgi:hypothetical protein